MSEPGVEHELHLQPVTFEEACAFVDRHHSTHDAPQGWKFGVGVNDGEGVVGVAMVGRPVSRHRDDGETLEVTRCATDGTKNAASKLYAAAWRAAKNMGYRRLITYTLADSEEGTPLKAIDSFEVLHERNSGGDWSSPSRPRVDTSPEEQKTLWEACTDGGINCALDTDMERRVRADCGFMTGWFDPDDAESRARRHVISCGSCDSLEDDCEFKEREKQETNHSDNRTLPPGPTCPHCGSGNVPGAVECGGCGGALVP